MQFFFPRLLWLAFLLIFDIPTNITAHHPHGMNTYPAHRMLWICSYHYFISYLYPISIVIILLFYFDCHSLPLISHTLCFNASMRNLRQVHEINRMFLTTIVVYMIKSKTLTTLMIYTSRAKQLVVVDFIFLLENQLISISH